MSEFDFERIYSELAPEIKRFIFTAARRDAGFTDEIFQNTWMNVYRYRESLKEPGKARGWVYAIARNEAKRFFALHGARFLAEVYTAEDEADATEQIADEQASSFPEALADADLIKTLIEKLDLSQQQLILLHYGHDISLKDIAEMYGANYNTIKSQLRRALAAMRKMAEPNEAIEVMEK
jgi:RNA polymerase sigma-70 factor (ECF subfamily)